jgi:hypothetical protein
MKCCHFILCCASVWVESVDQGGVGKRDGQVEESGNMERTERLRPVPRPVPLLLDQWIGPTSSHKLLEFDGHCGVIQCISSMVCPCMVGICQEVVAFDGLIESPPAVVPPVLESVATEAIHAKHSHEGVQVREACENKRLQDFLCSIICKRTSCSARCHVTQGGHSRTRRTNCVSFSTTSSPWQSARSVSMCTILSASNVWVSKHTAMRCCNSSTFNDLGELSTQIMQCWA